MSIEKNFSKALKKYKKDWNTRQFCIDCQFYGECPYRTSKQKTLKFRSGNRKTCPHWQEYQSYIRRMK